MSLVLTTPVYYVTRYLDTGSLQFTLTPFFESNLVPLDKFALAIVNGFVYVLFLFYPLYSIRYMRSRLVEFEPKLFALYDGGEVTLHKIFGRVSSSLPSVALALVFYAAFFPYTWGVIQKSGILFETWLLFALPLMMLLLATFFWVFMSSTWGIYRLGKETAMLKSYEEDAMLGLGAFGSLSLSLSVAYFVGIGTTLLLIATDPLAGFPLLMTMIFSVLALVGIGLFFLPLLGLHAKMRSEKKKELRKVREEAFRLLNEKSTGNSLDFLAHMEAIKMRERTVASLPTWPFDTGIVVRFSAIVLSVVAILLSRIFADVLNL